MRRWCWSVVGVVLASGCRSSGEPCSNRGVEVDRRPAPPWLDVLPGAVACHSVDGATDNEAERGYEFGPGPREARKAWGAHLYEHGWKNLHLKTDEPFEDEYVRGGQRLRLFCSTHIRDRGWCTLTLR